MDANMRDRLTRAGCAHLIEEIPRWPQNSILLRASAVDESGLEVGASKIGGCPDLPPGCDWPYYTHDRSRQLQLEEHARQWFERQGRLKRMGLLGRLRERWRQRKTEAAVREALTGPLAPVMVSTPLSFVAQIRLADVAPHDVDRLLLASGMLYFFYDAVDQPGGYGPADANGHRVFYYDGDLGALKRTPLPEELEQAGRLFTMSLQFEKAVSIPGWERMQLLGVPREEASAISESEFAGLVATPPAIEPDQPVHRMLGHPDEVQDDPLWGCAGSFLKLGCDDPRVRESAIRDWILLLQVDSIGGCPRPGVVWGDVGKIYFGIRREALQARDFSGVMLEHQCY